MRTFTAGVAVLLATLIAPLMIGGTWVAQRVDDRSAYVDTVSDLAKDRVVQRTLADASGDAAVAALQKYVPIALPGAVHDWASAAALQVVQGPAFPDFWDQANGDIHDQVLAVLDDANAPADGSITVDASPLVAQVLLQIQEHGVPVTLLPEIKLRVPVLSRAKVAEAGPAYRNADRVNRIIPFLWGGLLLLALVVARGWRGRLRAVGLGLLGLGVAAILVLVGAGPLGDRLIELVDVSRRELAGVMLDAVVGSLGPHARTFLIALPAGLVLFAVTLLPRRRRHGHDDAAWGQPVA